MKKYGLFALCLTLSFSLAMSMEPEDPAPPPMDESGDCSAQEHIKAAVHELYILASLAQALAMKIDQPVAPVVRIGHRMSGLRLQRSLSICDHHTKNLDPVIRRAAEFLLIGGEDFTVQRYVSDSLEVMNTIVGAIDELLIDGHRTPADLMASHTLYDTLCSMVLVWPMHFCEGVYRCGATGEKAAVIRQERAFMAQMVAPCLGECALFADQGGCMCSAMARLEQNSRIWSEIFKAFGQQREPVDMRGVLLSICQQQDAGDLPELSSGKKYSSVQIMFMLWLIAKHLVHQIEVFTLDPEVHVDAHTLARLVARLEQLRARNFLPE